MIISEERSTNLYAAFSDPITDLRIKNAKGMTVEEMDDKLFDLEREISRRVTATLNLTVNSQP